MAEIVFNQDVMNPRPNSESRWSIFRWSPTSNYQAIVAEIKLLARNLLIDDVGTGPVG
jgi:hypothetical protein